MARLPPPCLRCQVRLQHAACPWLHFGVPEQGRLAEADLGYLTAAAKVADSSAGAGNS